VSYASKVYMNDETDLDAGTGSGTFYVGAPKSRQRLRVYDKESESEGAIRAVRWELQGRAETAEEYAAALLAVPARAWGDVVAERLVSFVDFRDRSQGAESQDAPRLEWFEYVVGLARRVTGWKPQPLRTVESIRGWLMAQCAPSLALVVKADGGGGSFFRRLYAEGAERLTPRHLAILGAT